MKFLLSALWCVIYFVVFTEAKKYDKSSHGHRTMRMIGGTDARIQDHPYQVSLKWTYHGSKLFCGGAIVSDRHIVTAAHCLDDKLEHPKYIQVVSGSSRSNAEGNVHSVKSLTMHPGYDEASGDYLHDIAVVTLSEPIQFTSTQQPIELPSQNIVYGSEATITGWGYTSRINGKTPTYLRKAIVPLISGEQCQSWLTDTQICGLVVPGNGVCTGDSGGPLVANGQLVGVASYANHMCGTSSFDVYTNVYPYVGFIDNIIKSRIYQPNSNTLMYF